VLKEKKRKKEEKKALQDEYKNFSSTTDMGMLVSKSPLTSGK